MKIQLNRLLLILAVLLSGQTFAQLSDQQMAAHYFNNGDFEKAVIYYEKLYNQQSTDYYYQFYLKTLLELKQYKDAEKLVKQQKKRYNNVSYNIDLAQIYELTGDQDKAEEMYRESIRDVRPEQSSIMLLGNALLSKGKQEMALEVYEIGKRDVRHYPFGLNTAELHGKLGDEEKMINDYIDVFDQFPKYWVRIQNELSAAIDFENPNNPTTELLRTTLLKRIQKNPDNISYIQLLIWFYLESEDYNAAIVQGKALDRRLKSQGEHVINLARTFSANKAYSDAIKAYNYVLENYPEGPYAVTATRELMSTLYDKVTSSAYTQEDLLSLESKYQEVLSEDQLGVNNSSIGLMIKYARIEAFYLHNRTKAISILKEALAVPGISKKNMGLCKLELGDVQLMRGETWSASLNYMQVEKTFKEDVLGHEAKFRTAKVFYYEGQFEYAQSMLNVLKASTSKLIANDAMELSILITDNMGLDTTPRPMMLFAQADLLIYQNRFNEAILMMDTIQNEYGGHALLDEILWRKYEIAFKQKKYTESAEYLDGIIKDHAFDILGDDATYTLAVLYDNYIKDTEKAKALYKKIIFDYSGSIYTVEARKRFRAMGGNSDTNNSFKKIN